MKDHFTYGSPTITGITPAVEPIPAGEQVTITGSGFAPGHNNTVLTFGKTSGGDVRCNSSTECTAIAPMAAGAGTVDVRASSDSKKSAAASAGRFTYETPTITSLSEQAGPLTGGVELAVHGIGFASGTSNTTFTFGKVRAIRVSCSTSTECTLLTPAASKPGAVEVTATVGKTTSTTSPADQYNYE